MKKAIDFAKKNTFRILTISLIMLLGLPLFSTQLSSGQEDQINRWEAFIYPTDVHGSIVHFNPYNPSYGGEWGGDAFCAWESIMYLNPDNGTLYGWLCTGYEYSNDFKTLKWFVRESPQPKWNDGVLFTAKDMEYTLKMIQSDPAASSQNLVADMESIYTEDNDMTLVINYATPKPFIWTYFINLVYSGWPVVPEHYWSLKVNTGQTGGESLPKPSEWAPTANEDLVTTGPFMAYSVQIGGPYIYKRNDNYWGKDWEYAGLPKMKWVIQKEMLNKESLIMGIAGNDFDQSTTHLTWEAFVRSLNSNPYLQWQEHIDPNPRAIYLNIDKYPWNYTSVRWALAHAINQPLLIEYASEGHGVLHYLPQTPGSEVILRQYVPDTVGIGKKFDPTVYNPEELPEALSEVGCTKGTDGYWYDPNGNRLAFEIYVWGLTKSMGELIADMLRNQGIEMSVKAPEWAEGVSKLTGGTMDMCASWMWGSKSQMELFTWLSTHLYSKHGELLKPRGEMMSSAIDFVRWRNDTFDDIVEETIALGIGPGDAKFTENCKKLFEIFYEELPIIPLYAAMNFGYVNNYYWNNWPVTGGRIANGQWVETNPSTLYAFPIVAAWCDNPHLILFKLQPTGRGVEQTPTTYMYIWFTEAVAQFVGSDSITYGPFVSGDSVRIPETDANELIESGKATATPSIPGLEGVIETLTTLVTGQSQLITTLNNQMNMLTVGLVIEGVVIVLLVVFIMMRKK